MATQRKGKEGDISETQEKDSKRVLEEMKARRRQAKLQTLKKQAYINYTWNGLAALLVLLLVGTVVYYSLYAPPTAKPKSKPAVNSTAKTDTRTKQEAAPKNASSNPAKEASAPPKKTIASSSKKPDATPTVNSADSSPKKNSRSTSKKPSDKPSKEPQTETPPPVVNSRTTTLADDREIPLLQRPVPPGDPDRPYIIELLAGEKFTRNGRYNEALERYNDILKRFPQSPRAMYGKGLTLELQAKEKKSNKLTDMAIDFMSKVGFESFLAPNDFKESALLKLAEMAQLRGKHTLLVQALEKLHELFPTDEWYMNKLGVAYVNNQNTKKAKSHFQKARKAFPNNYFASAHLGLILMMENKHEKAIPLLLEGLQHDEDIKSNPKFYLYTGASLTALGKIEEAYSVYDVAVARGLLPSKMQRSIYNEPGLRAKSWWSDEESGIKEGLQRLHSSWKEIRDEALASVDSEGGMFGSSSHLLLFSMGKKNLENCKKVPKTCALLETIPAMSGCTRGQVKLVSIQPSVHIAPYTASSNTQLHYLLGLDLASPLTLRSGEEKRSLEEGNAVVSDPSFEQEVWYQSSKFGILLTADFWHPDLTESRYLRLPKL